MKKRICFLSIDVEEDLHPDGQKSFLGVEKLDAILDIFRKYNARATLFVTGEVLERYSQMIKRWAINNEIACHGYWHKPLSQLPVEEREKGIIDFVDLYRNILGKEPKGFRAVQNVIDNEQFELLSKHNFLYDSSVVPNYPPMKKYVGYKGPAPRLPYHPKSTNHLLAGEMKILEIPLSPHFLGIPLVGTWLRKMGVKLFRFLFLFYRPKFLSFSMHSWDIVPNGDKNRGPEYLKQLDTMLAYLKKKKYTFASGEGIYEDYK